ncbi:MAG: hypothetical protein N3A54_02175 [Patescibacteria group bacterium]|nr:hypothetical protein [Patescibacteria group bacterium]
MKYLYKYTTLVLDSRRLDSYSQLWINSDGVFRVSISVPIFYYHDNEWINAMGDGRQEETFRR